MAGAKAPVEQLKAWIDESYRALAPKKYGGQLETVQPAAPAAVSGGLRPKAPGDTKSVRRKP
jgi:hypothetical protein